MSFSQKLYDSLGISGLKSLFPSGRTKPVDRSKVINTYDYHVAGARKSLKEDPSLENISNQASKLNHTVAGVCPNLVFRDAKALSVCYEEMAELADQQRKNDPEKAETVIYCVNQYKEGLKVRLFGDDLKMYNDLQASKMNAPMPTQE